MIARVRLIYPASQSTSSHFNASNSETRSPPGAPNIMMAAGGTQLKNIFRLRWNLCLEGPTGVERTGQHQSERSRKNERGALPFPLQRPDNKLRAATGHRKATRRARG